MTSSLASHLPLVAVVARARNGVIGAQNSLPWRLPSDLKHYRERTWGRPIIMGRRTYELIGRPLPGRESVIVTRQADYAAPGAHVASSLDELLTIARGLAARMGAPEIIVAGGEEIYRALLERTELIELTEVALDARGDAYFPPLTPGEWEEIARETPPRGAKDAADFAFVTLRRRR